MPKEKVRCIHVEGSGCYGHNGADDAGADAALLAMTFPGRPVRLQWMRDQEHTWEPYGPAMVSEIRGTLDATGNVVDFSYEVWSNTHSTRPESAGNMMAGWLVSQPSRSRSHGRFRSPRVAATATPFRSTSFQARR
jgi:CO/xanthine dehydrogenase Mo-binding subunit